MTMIPNQYDESGFKPEPDRLLKTINYFLQGLKDRNADGDISDQHYRDDVERVEDLEVIYKLLLSYASTNTQLTGQCPEAPSDKEIEKQLQHSFSILGDGWERNEELLTIYKELRQWMRDNHQPSLPSEDGWIKCSDRLPKDDQECDLWHKDKGRCINYHFLDYQANNKRLAYFRCNDGGILQYYLKDITHWQPSPKPPNNN